MSHRISGLRGISLVIVCLASFISAQSQTVQAPASASVPALVKFSGTVNVASGRLVGLTFALYKDQTGGAPLWLGCCK